MKPGRRGTASTKGELFELSQDLNSLTSSVRKSALKRTIRAMTAGKDVSSLFTSVLKLLSHSSLPIKKLVYLYLVHYCAKKPDLAIQTVHSFQKDAADPSPVVRALAIRTIAAINVEIITQHSLAPLHKALSDPDPYVRKTAAIAVAKIANHSPNLVVEEGFIPDLQRLLSDRSPVVFTNALAALSEIGMHYLELNGSLVRKYLSILAECTEWGQVFILDVLSAYNPTDEQEADNLIEIIIPRLQHLNSAVVLSTVRLLLRYMEYLTNSERIAYLERKLSAPLVTLLSVQPELQYVALKSIALIIGKRPSLMASHVKTFFVSYTDPFYVKREKLRSLVKLATKENEEEILAELKQYIAEVDVAFVNLAIEAIGDIAMSLPSSAVLCVDMLQGFLQERNPSMIDSAAISLSKIIRRYPGQFTESVRSICMVSELLESPASRAALVWLVGKHASILENAEEMMNTFLSTMNDEHPSVQQQILIAVVKCSIMLNSPSSAMMRNAIKFCRESDNVDLRDRAIVFERLCQYPEEAKRIFNSPQPSVCVNRGIQEPLLTQYLRCLGSIAAVEYQPLHDFYQARTGRGITCGFNQVTDNLLIMDEDADEVKKQAGPLAIEASAAHPSSSNRQEGKRNGLAFLDDLLGEGLAA